MNRFFTIFLLLLAIAAGVFLFVFEPRMTSTRLAEATKDYVLTFDPRAIESVRVAVGDDGFELDRGEGGWTVGPKPKDIASPQKVNDLLNAAASLRIFDVIRADELGGGRDLDTYGLGKSKNWIDFKGAQTETLYFGKEAASDGRVYVRRGDSNDVFIVSDDLQRLAFRNPQDFRDRRLTSLGPDQIDKFSIRRGSGELSLERGSKGWELVRPLRAPADSAAVDKLLKGLLGTQIQDFVADESDDLSAYGLGEPRAELVFGVDGEARPVALRIGADAGAKGVVAQFTGRDSVYHLPQETWTALQVSPDDLRDRRLASLNLDTVDAVRLGVGPKEWSIERSGEDWKSGEKKVSGDVMEKLAKAFSETKVNSYLPLNDANLRLAGLDKPSDRISFDAWLSENTPETTAGRHPVVTFTIGRTDGDKTYLRVDEDPEICVVPSSLLESLPAKP